MNLLSRLSNLTHLTLHTKCHDGLLDTISKTCPKLKHFESRQDPLFSDMGLSQLHNCRDLVSIILTDRDQPRYTYTLSGR